MKNLIAATTFTALLLSGVAAADNGFPCTKAQFWISSLDTVPAGAEIHKRSTEIAIAAQVLKPRPATKLAQQSAPAQSKI